MSTTRSVQESDSLTDEQADAMLERLRKHFREPVMPVSRYCRALETWAEKIVEWHHREKGSKYGPSRGYAPHLGMVMLDIRKSNLLWRLIYCGEKLRTRPCPEHKGKWSGLEWRHPDTGEGDWCKHGCHKTGWLPEPGDE